MSVEWLMQFTCQFDSFKKFKHLLFFHFISFLSYFIEQIYIFHYVIQIFRRMVLCVKEKLIQIQIQLSRPLALEKVPFFALQMILLDEQSI